MTDLQQAAERVAKSRRGIKHQIKTYKQLCRERGFNDDVRNEVSLYHNDCELLAHAYLDLRAEILLACLEEATYDGLHARLMELHERGE